MSSLQRRVCPMDTGYVPKTSHLDKVISAGFASMESYNSYINGLPIIRLTRRGKKDPAATSAQRFVFQMEPFEYLRLSTVLNLLGDLVYTPVPDGGGFLPLVSSRLMRGKGYTFNYRPPSQDEVTEYLFHTHDVEVTDVPFVGKQHIVCSTQTEGLRTLGKHVGESLMMIMDTLPAFAELLIDEDFYVYNRKYLICVKCGVAFQFRTQDLVDLPLYDISRVRRTHDSSSTAYKCPRRQDQAADEIEAFVELFPEMTKKVIGDAVDSLRDMHTDRKKTEVVRAVVRAKKPAPPPPGKVPKWGTSLALQGREPNPVEDQETENLPRMMSLMDFA